MGVSKKTQGQSGYDYASMLFDYHSLSLSLITFSQLYVDLQVQPFYILRF